jgi:CYTH domain-containing protein
MLRRLILYSDAIFSGQNRGLVVAELTRDERTQLIELLRF